MVGDARRLTIQLGRSRTDKRREKASESTRLCSVALVTDAEVQGRCYPSAEAK